MEDKPFNVSVNQAFTFDLSPTQLEDLDLVPNDDGSYHLLVEGKAYRVEVLEPADGHKAVRLKVNGDLFEVQISDAYDQLLNRLGLSLSTEQKVDEVTAPMPGMVLSVNTEAGQVIEKGDPLVILEAMKMENIIKSPGEGSVKEVLVKAGQSVDKGQVLLRLD